jgi:hypothetical protein
MCKAFEYSVCHPFKGDKCLGNFEECQEYIERLYLDALNLPLTCPLIVGNPWEVGEYQKCSLDNNECDEGWISLDTDYRKCELFSKWFWTKQKGE